MSVAVAINSGESDEVAINSGESDEIGRNNEAEKERHHFPTIDKRHPSAEEKSVLQRIVQGVKCRKRSDLEASAHSRLILSGCVLPATFFTISMENTPVQHAVEVSRNVPRRILSLRELAVSSVVGQPITPAQVNAWIVNFEAVNPPPRRFLYRACPFDLPHGKCRKSLEWGDRCRHGSDMSQCLHVYRMEILLCDMSGPYWVSIFDAMETLLRMPAEVFNRLPTDLQLQNVQAIVKEVPFSSLSLSYSKGRYVIQSIRFLEPQHRSFNNPPPLAVHSSIQPSSSTQTTDSAPDSTDTSTDGIDENELISVTIALKKL